MERKQTASEVTARLIGAASLLRKRTYFEKACASTSRRGAEIFQNSSGSAAEATYCGKQPQPRPARVQAPANETRSHEPLVRHNSITFDLSALAGRRPRFRASAQKSPHPKRAAQAPPAKLATALLATRRPACGTKCFAPRQSASSKSAS